MSLKLDKSTWARVKFGDVIDSVTDRVDNPSEAGVDRYVGLEHLDPGVMTVQRWGSPDEVEAQKLRFQPGDVIFGRRRAYQKKVAMAEFEGICSAHALVLRARSEHVHPDFLPVFLSSDYFLDRAIGISVGSLSPTVNWRDLQVQEFDLPPLDEQKRIADLLWAIERHRLRLQEKMVRVSTAHEAWLEGRLSRLASRPLGELVSLQHGRPVSSALYGKGTFPLLRPGDMKADGRVVSTETSVGIPDDFVARYTNWILQPGDLVINMTAQSLEDRFLGRVCQIQHEALLNQRIGRLLTGDRSLKNYLFIALRTAAFAQWVMRRSEGSKVKHMHWRHIEDYPVPLPSSVEQEAIVQDASKWTTSLVDIDKERGRIIGLREALFSDVFGGE